MEIGDYRQDRTDTIAANLLQAFERFTTKDEKQNFAKIASLLPLNQKRDGRSSKV